MKKLEETLLLQSDKIFEKALFYSNGDLPLALTRIAKSVSFIARKYKHLANKERALDLFYEKLKSVSVARVREFSSHDVREVISFALNDVQRKRKARIGILSLMSVLLIVGAIFVLLLPGADGGPNDGNSSQQNTNGEGSSPSAALTIMKNTETLQGDVGTGKLINYHTISTALGKKTKPEGFQDHYTNLGRMAATVTAPDGSSYAVYQNIETEDGSPTTFTLYRADSNGWTEIGIGEVTPKLISDNLMVETIHFHQPWIHLVSDADSNIYTVTVVNDEIVIYRYDPENGTFGLTEATMPIALDSYWNYMNICFDKTFGERGAVYIGTVNMSDVQFYRYDIAGDEITHFGEIGSISGNVSLEFSVRDSVIHAVTTESIYPKQLVYYTMTEEGVQTCRVLSTFMHDIMDHSEYIGNRGGGSGGIEVDSKGNAHIITTYMPSAYETDWHIYHYVVTPNGEVTKNILNGLYYTEGYEPNCAAVFTDTDGEIYFMETYKSGGDFLHFIAIGKLNEESGQFEYFEGFDLQHNISANKVKVFGQTFLFITSEGSMVYFYMDTEVKVNR